MEESNQMFVRSYEALAEKNRDLRKANVKLLEEKRELLLQMQQGNRARSEATRLSEKCEELTKKIEMLEFRQKDLSYVDVPNQSSDVTIKRVKEVGLINFANEDEKAHCSCESGRKLNEAIKVNHQWNDAYQRSIERFHKLEKTNRRVEEELEVKNEENRMLRDLIKDYESDVRLKNKSAYQRSVSREKFCSNDDIEALKLQLQAYQEDFNCEKEEKDNLKTESRTYKMKLQEANSVIEALQNQLDEYKHYVARIVEEKQMILRKIRSLSDSSFFETTPMFHAPVHRNGSYPLNSNDIIPRSCSSSRLRRSDSDLYKGADVVIDSDLRTPSR